MLESLCPVKKSLAYYGIPEASPATQETCSGADCGKGLGYPKNTHVNSPLRLSCYVDGRGQLCGSCYRKMYPD